MEQRVCPWWFGYLLVSPLRRLVQDPSRILAPLVREGMTVLEPGPGMGFFTLELARRVGPTGRIVAVDLQPKMLASLRKRAERLALGNRIQTREATANSLGVDDLAGKVDLVLAFYMVHELPDPARFFEEVRRAVGPGGRVLVVEPIGHVSSGDFDGILSVARRAGFRTETGPVIRWSHTALLA